MGTRTRGIAGGDGAGGQGCAHGPRMAAAPVPGVEACAQSSLGASEGAGPARLGVRPELGEAVPAGFCGFPHPLPPQAPNPRGSATQLRLVCRPQAGARDGAEHFSCWMSLMPRFGHKRRRKGESHTKQGGEPGYPAAPSSSPWRPGLQTPSTERPAPGASTQAGEAQGSLGPAPPTPLREPSSAWLPQLLSSQTWLLSPPRGLDRP